MIRDIRELPDGSTVDVDLLIIGGGMAGITLAREWSGRTPKVAILESGGKAFDAETQDLYRGQGTLAGPDNQDIHNADYVGQSRARFYGGSGNWWGGKCVPLDPADFAARPWLGVDGWPISRTDLQPFYDRACDALKIPRFDSDYSQPLHDGRPPLQIHESRHITSLPRDHTNLTGRAPKPFDEFRYGFTEHDNVSVYLQANVVDFELRAGSTELASVGIQTLDGKRYRARAKVFVLACGGIENARLLLVANARNNTKFGVRSDAIGRYFQGHTVISRESSSADEPATRLSVHRAPSTLSLYADRRRGRPHAVLGTSEAGQQKYRTAAFTVTLGLERTAEGAVERAVRATAARVDSAASNGPADHARCWAYFMTENLPNPDSRVTLDEATDALGMPRAKLRWEYGKADFDHFERSVDAFARELGSAGLGRVSAPLARQSLLQHMTPSRHHSGTTRMHTDPKRGVVDQNLKLHDADNLYITGSSVFPTSGIANPTLTILALTLRLSDHLKPQLGG